jgi:molybdopterin converting factor subunit 1
MLVSIKLFAEARELAGTAEVGLLLDEVATIADVKRTLLESYPQLERLLGRCAIARNCDYATDADAIVAGDELAVIPPVSGG